MPKEAAEAATASSIATRLILSSSFYTSARHPSGPGRAQHELWDAAYYDRSRQLFGDGDAAGWAQDRNPLPAAGGPRGLKGGDLPSEPRVALPSLLCRQAGVF